MINKQIRESFRKHVGLVVERIRLSKGISRRELGEALGYEGNSAVQVIARIESGRVGIPKNKINQLVDTLEIKNSDFGLAEHRSIKQFLSSAGFLGSVGMPVGNVFIDYMEAHAAKLYKQSLEMDNDNEDVQEQDQSKDFTSLARLTAIYRTDDPPKNRPLLSTINHIYDVCKGDEKVFCDICISLKLDPDDCYRVVEENLVKRLKSSKKD